MKYYFRSLDDEEDDGPICTLFVDPPIAIVRGGAFSCDKSVKVCCRRLNSLSLSVVNCDDDAVAATVDDDDDDTGGGGGLFSISNLTLSLHSVFKSDFTVALASADEVDDDTEGGLASRKERTNHWRYVCYEVRIEYMLSMDHDVDCVMMYQRLMKDVN